MKLKELTFSEDNVGDAVPSTITVEMTVEEALWIAKVAGKTRGGGGSIYNCLVDDVFNRYWDDGANGANLQFNVEIPPIKYPDQE